MGYTNKFAANYIDMVKDLKVDNEIMNLVNKYLKEGSTMVELGSATGIDYNVLSKRYDVMASDYSEVFIEHLKLKGIEAFNINATDFQLSKKYDSFYTNKVLCHLDKRSLKRSIELQLRFLHDGGFMFHSLWKGDKHEVIKGQDFYYYEPEFFDSIKELEKVEVYSYKEFEDNDSFLIVLKKRG